MKVLLVLILGLSALCQSIPGRTSTGSTSTSAGGVTANDNRWEQIQDVSVQQIAPGKINVCANVKITGGPTETITITATGTGGTVQPPGGVTSTGTLSTGVTTTIPLAVSTGEATTIPDGSTGTITQPTTYTVQIQAILLRQMVDGSISVSGSVILAVQSNGTIQIPITVVDSSGQPIPSGTIPVSPTLQFPATALLVDGTQKSVLATASTCCATVTDGSATITATLSSETTATSVMLQPFSTSVQIAKETTGTTLGGTVIVDNPTVGTITDGTMSVPVALQATDSTLSQWVLVDINGVTVSEAVTMPVQVTIDKNFILNTSYALPEFVKFYADWNADGVYSEQNELMGIEVFTPTDFPTNVPICMEMPVAYFITEDKAVNFLVVLSYGETVDIGGTTAFGDVRQATATVTPEIISPLEVLSRFIDKVNSLIETSLPGDTINTLKDIKKFAQNTLDKANNPPSIAGLNVFTFYHNRINELSEKLESTDLFSLGINDQLLLSRYIQWQRTMSNMIPNIDNITTTLTFGKKRKNVTVCITKNERVLIFDKNGSEILKTEFPAFATPILNSVHVDKLAETEVINASDGTFKFHCTGEGKTEFTAEVSLTSQTSQGYGFRFQDTVQLFQNLCTVCKPKIIPYSCRKRPCKDQVSENAAFIQDLGECDKLYIVFILIPPVDTLHMGVIQGIDVLFKIHVPPEPDQGFSDEDLEELDDIMPGFKDFIESLVEASKAPKLDTKPGTKITTDENGNQFLQFSIRDVKVYKFGNGPQKACKELNCKEPGCYKATIPECNPDIRYIALIDSSQIKDAIGDDAFNYLTGQQDNFNTNLCSRNETQADISIILKQCDQSIASDKYHLELFQSPVGFNMYGSLAGHLKDLKQFPLGMRVWGVQLRFAASKNAKALLDPVRRDLACQETNFCNPAFMAALVRNLEFLTAGALREVIDPSSPWELCLTHEWKFLSEDDLDIAGWTAALNNVKGISGPVGGLFLKSALEQFLKQHHKDVTKAIEKAKLQKGESADPEFEKDILGAVDWWSKERQQIYDDLISELSGELELDRDFVEKVSPTNPDELYEQYKKSVEDAIKDAGGKIP